MSDFKFKGKIIAIGEKRQGTSSNGNWAVQEYTIQEEAEQYPMKMTFEVFGEDKINTFAIKEGESLTIHFRMDSKEYNGRNYNTIRAWKVEREAQAQAQAQPVQQKVQNKKSNEEPPF